MRRVRIDFYLILFKATTSAGFSSFYIYSFDTRLFLCNAVFHLWRFQAAEEADKLQTDVSVEDLVKMFNGDPEAYFAKRQNQVWDFVLAFYW